MVWDVPLQSHPIHYRTISFRPLSMLLEMHKQALRFIDGLAGPMWNAAAESRDVGCLGVLGGAGMAGRGWLMYRERRGKGRCWVLSVL